MYDAIARALPIAAAGRNQKKAILVISDGNDTNSRTSVSELRNLIRESEVMVYALGVDGNDVSTYVPQPRQPNGPRIPIPIPIPGGRGRFPGGRFPFGHDLQPQIQFPPIGGGRVWGRTGSEHVNENALRAVTDDTGGRTEIVHGFGDLASATEHIADELSKQYYLGYNSAGQKDGRWHAIKVELRDRHLHVRARRGYVAS
jgi:VWFA-related protein